MHERLSNAAEIVVITALRLEYQAVRDCLTDLRPVEHPRFTHFEVGPLPGTSWRIAVTEAGVGNRIAAIVTDRAIGLFEPAAILVVGVAGGLSTDVGLGDVVVGTKVYDYEGGVETDNGFLTRPQCWNAPYALEQSARQLARTNEWARLLHPATDIPAPRVHFGPVASGAVVLASRTGTLAQRLRRHFNDAAAIEMESAGAAHAAHLNATPILTVRGISDHADCRKRAADDQYNQPVAAHHAATFAVALACGLARRNDLRRPRSIGAGTRAA